MRPELSFSRFVIGRPRTVIAVVAVLTVVLSFGMGGIVMKTDLTDEIPSSLPEKRYYDEVGRIFPSDDFLFVALERVGGIYDASALETLRELTSRLEAVPGIKGVISLANAGVISGTEGGIEIRAAMREVPADAAAMAAFRKLVESGELTKSLVSADGKASAVIATLREGTDDERFPVVRVRLPAGKASAAGLASVLDGLVARSLVPAVASVAYDDPAAAPGAKKASALVRAADGVDPSQWKAAMTAFVRLKGKPDWKLAFASSELRITIPIAPGKGAEGTARDLAAFSAACERALAPAASGEVPGVGAVLAAGDPGAEYRARVVYGIDISKDGGRTALVVPTENVRLSSLGEAVKAALAGTGAKVDWSEKKHESLYRVKEVLASLSPGEGGRFHVSGSRAASTLVTQLMSADLSVLFPVVILIIAASLYLSFRTARGVFLPLANVVIAVLWALGAMGYAGVPLSMATMILPIILIAVGTAYTIHVINRSYEDFARIPDKKEALFETLRRVRLPVFLAGITTVIGFGSLAVSSIRTLAVFGILSALGIVAALALALTFTPAVLSVLPLPRRSAVEAHGGSVFARALGSLGRLIARGPRTVVAISAVLVVAAALGVPHIRFETNTLNSFRKGTEIRTSSEFLNANFTGITVMKVVVRSARDGGIYEPATLSAIDSLQGYLETLRISKGKVLEPGASGYEGGTPIVGGTQSIATFVKGINKAVHADGSAFNAIPAERVTAPVEFERYAWDASTGILSEYDAESGERLRGYRRGEFTEAGGVAILAWPGVAERRVELGTGAATDVIEGSTAISNYVLLYSNAGDPEDLASFVDSAARTAAVNVFVKSSSSTVLGSIQKIAAKRIDATFPEGAEGHITGLSSLTTAVLGLLVDTQIKSIATSFIICFFVMFLLSRSFVEALYSVIPLGIALVSNFGLMGYLGIAIDISTATIASIAIGIGIDYTIHFMERYKHAAKEYGRKEAVAVTLETTGQGIIFNALAVAAGFCALVFSRSTGNVNMGLLMAFIMVLSSLAAITTLPALLVIFEPEFVVKGPDVGDA
ncbi:MAG: MMPL family transporter [Spirochaetes bacterium]|nr:MMPL family transporter [Spirochaetota bacterium]